MSVDDTSPKALAVMTELLAAMTPAQRVAMCLEMTDFVIDQSRAAIAATMPGATTLEVQLRWSELNYGVELTDKVRRFLAERAR